MPIVVARTFIVTAPAPTVLDYLTDFGHTEEWDPDTRRATRADSGPIVVGSSWRHESRVLGVRAELTYTLCAAGPHRVVFIGRDEGATSTGTFVIRPVDGGTEVTYQVDLEMHGVAKLATPVMRIEYEKLGTETAARLTGALNRLTSQAA